MVVLGDEGLALAVGALASVHLLHQDVTIQIIIYTLGDNDKRSDIAWLS